MPTDLAPDKIVHTWAEVYYKGQWLALEGVITDNQYLEAVKAKYSHVQGEFMKFAIATKDFQNISVDWDENSTYIAPSLFVDEFLYARRLIIQHFSFFKKLHIHC